MPAKPALTHAENMALLRRWARLLDAEFSIPGTRFRFGLDPVLGLVPGVGDLVTPLFSGLILLHAYKVGVPRIVQVRMLINVLLDALVGVIPFAGDLFDFVWQANTKNLALLEDHSLGPVKRTNRDWLFVIVALGVLGAAVLLPFLVLFWVLDWIYSMGPGAGR